MRAVVSAARRPLPPMMLRLAPSPAVIWSCDETITASRRSGCWYRILVLPRATSGPLFMRFLPLEYRFKSERRGLFERAHLFGEQPRALFSQACVARGVHQRAQLRGLDILRKCRVGGDRVGQGILLADLQRFPGRHRQLP